MILLSYETLSILFKNVSYYILKLEFDRQLKADLSSYIDEKKLRLQLKMLSRDHNIQQNIKIEL